MRKLLALLVLLPLLVGVHAGRAAPAAGATMHADVLAAAGHAAVQPPLPGLSVGAALLLPALDVATRTPTRAGRSPTDPLARAETPRARTRLIQRHSECLAYTHRLRLAQTNVPVSYGTPPPTSET